MRTKIYYLSRALTKLIFIWVLFYCVFYLWRYFKPSQIILPFLIAALLYVAFEFTIKDFLKNALQKLLLPNYLKINLLIENYNKKLNSMIKRNEIEEQLTFLFNHAFKYNSWVIFNIKEQYFEKISKSKQIRKKIINQIPIEKRKYLKGLKNSNQSYFLIEDVLLKELEFKKRFEKFIDDNNFQYVIPIKSYHNLVGLIFFDSSFINFMEFNELKKNFNKIINKTSEMLEKADLYDGVELQYKYTEQLLDVNKIITSSLNLDNVLNSIMDAVLGFVKYDAATIFLVDDLKQELNHKYLKGYDESEIKNLHIKRHQGIVGKTILSGIPSNIPDVSQSHEYYQLRKNTKSQLTIPLYSGKKAIGAIALESDKVNNFSQHDLAVLQTFAINASIAINNAWMYKSVLEKKQMESDLLNASQVQQALLIKRAPYLKRISMSISSHPCKLVGGDFYDIQKITDNKLLVGIGDVSGKGAPGALLMAVVMAGLRSFYKQVYSVCEIIARLNTLLSEATTSSYYATMFLAMIDKEKKQIIYTNAGHNPPIIIRKNGEIEILSGGGMVVGFRKEIEYQQFKKELHKDDIIILFTDGLEEAQNASNEEFGVSRIKKIIKNNSQLSLQALKNKILEEVRNYTGYSEFEDDLTFILIKIKD